MTKTIADNASPTHNPIHKGWWFFIATITPPPNIEYQEASYAANANFRNALDKFAAKHIADLEVNVSIPSDSMEVK